ncbi:RlpA-like double-psi beta-barrel-protein domain-containing protein-containing protein [Suillus tomentosus]|nr:RlpA-like double-psi beta-barrel-protein domain-containing protein-containing protein [Suillus tomentosus]
MFSTFATLVLSLIATSAVSALVVPRTSAPQGWDTSALEPYDTYHCRYVAIQCQTQHNTQFFSDCCHPLAAGESASALPAQCQMPSGVTCSNGEPESNASPSASSPVAAPAPTTTSTTEAVSTTAPSTGSSDSSLNYGGYATYFYQEGNPGACGTVHSDSDFICAMDQSRYGNSGNTSPLCGQQVQITNQINGNTVVVTIADDCPTCQNSNSIDLSVAAFQALDDLSVGDLPITWKFLN